MKALKALIKPFEALRRRVKKEKKIELIFILICLYEMHLAGRVNVLWLYFFLKVFECGYQAKKQGHRSQNLFQK